MAAYRKVLHSLVTSRSMWSNLTCVCPRHAHHADPPVRPFPNPSPYTLPGTAQLTLPKGLNDEENVSFGVHQWSTVPPAWSVDLSGKSVIVGANYRLQNRIHFACMSPAKLAVACRSERKGKVAVSGTFSRYLGTHSFKRIEMALYLSRASLGKSTLPTSLP